MVAIDERWDYFKAYGKAGYQKPREHPDIQPAHEAVILWEHFREAQRLEMSMKLGKDFLERLQAVETLAQTVEKSLLQQEADPAPTWVDLDRQFDALAQSCAACHKIYRDRQRW